MPQTKKGKNPMAKTTRSKTITKSKKKSSKLPKLFGRRIGKPAVFAMLFALVGVGTVLLSFAAVPRGEIVNKHYNECLENFFDRQLDGNFLSVYPCRSDNNAQKWNIYSSDKSIRTDQGYCLDVKRVTNAQGVKVDAKAPKSGVHLWRCTGGTPQKWDVLSDGTLRNPSSGLCLEAADKDTFLGGPNLYINTCNAGNARQVWTTPSSPVPVPTPPPSNPEPEPTPSPSVGDRPSAANTGPTSGASKRGAIKITQDGYVLRNVHIDAGGANYGIDVQAKNVVIENVIVENAYSAGIYCRSGSSCNIRNSEVFNMQRDGIKIHGVAALVENNYVHHLGRLSGSHADMVQMQRASNATFRNNFCDIGFPPPSGYRGNACFQIQDDTHDVLIENNWLKGGNYTINCKKDTGLSNITIRDNWFGSHQYGRVTGCSSTGEKSF